MSQEWFLCVKTHLDEVQSCKGFVNAKEDFFEVLELHTHVQLVVKESVHLYNAEIWSAKLCTYAMTFARISLFKFIQFYYKLYLVNSFK